MHAATSSPSPGPNATPQQELRPPLLGPATPNAPPRIRRCTTDDHVRSWSQTWNGLVDETFYNVGDKDKQAIEERVARYGLVTEGSVVVVSPRKSEAPQYFPDAYEFLSSSLRKNVRALCVPGVGSSVLGAVGLARDVADSRNVLVAAVVSGFGLNEVLFDALGGAIFFRGMNQLELALEHARRGLANMVTSFGLLPAIETYDSAGGGSALACLKSILRAGRLPQLELLVGHSKGNLLLSGAVAELACEGAPLEYLQSAKIVLFSAISAIPDVAAQTLQIIGDLDWLGWMNSRLTIPYKPVAGAMHHLNRNLPFYLDAASELAAL